MKNTIGQILRIVGLLIEFVGIYFVFGAGRQMWDQGSIWRYLPMFALGLGFVMWVTGRVVIYQSKRERVRAAASERWL